MTGTGNRKPFGAAQARILQQAAVLVLLGSSRLLAADLGSVGGFDVRLDTTVRLSLGLRLEGQDNALLGDVNGDDGDRAFSRGVMSERVDFTAVLDATRGDLGFEISTDGWYDAIYHQADANRSQATYNPVGIASSSFPADTSRLLGDTVELGTAYVHDRFEVAGLPVTVRVGRQSLLWGESLFFPQDGIAAGQAPVDEIKELSQPLVEDQEVFLPVDQIFLRAELAHNVSVQAYEQLEWRRDRIPGVASYFSSSDVGDVGGERVFLPGGTSLFRGRDATPGDFGQFGGALRYSSAVLDLGLYALRYQSKEGFVQSEPGSYHLVFPRGIQTFGASASGYVGGATIAGEIAVRRHMPLVSTGFADALGGVGFPAGKSPAPVSYATGETLQGLASFDDQLPTGRLWQGATFDVEFSTTELLDVESNAGSRLAGTTRFASAVEAVFKPQYFQILPELDLTLPVGVEWGLSGRSSVDPGQVARVGNVTVSASATYASVWEFGVSYTHFLGPVTQQALRDRDFLTLSLGRTF